MSGGSATPSVRATAVGTSAGSDSGIRSTSQTPPGHAPTWRDAASSASLVLPAPPMPVSVTRRCSQQPLEVRELALAADDSGHRCGKVVPRLRRRRGGDLLAQDGALEHAELLARLQPEFLGQQPACAPIGGERVRLALAPVERNHQHPPEPFAQRLLRDEALELGDELRVAAESEPCFDLLLPADQAKLVQALRLER